MRLELNELDLTMPVADLEAELDVIADNSGLAVNVRVRGVWVAQLLLTVEAQGKQLDALSKQVHVLEAAARGASRERTPTHPTAMAA